MESFSHLFQQLEKQELEEIKEEINKEEEQDTDVCPHYFTSIEHSFVLCLSCGLELDSFPEEKSIEPSRCYARKIKDKSIYLDIEHLAISERIKDLANEIYIQVCNFSKPRRGLNRKGIIFASIFHAYKLSNNPQSCESLLRIFNIKRKVALKGLKFINENTPPRSPLRTTYITPEHLIQEFMKRFNAGEDEIKKVVDLYKKIKGKSSMMNRSRPQSVAAGLIYFYIMVSGKQKQMNMKDFVKKVSLSELTIYKLAKECERIINMK